ncbi:Succinate--CoA ligase [ADP-forming] subunit beta, mitochondrial [Ascosphaera pollenicola]|nr:Succinate--CoA ligase [ADP-forming] subunit beta, mitochondrial [Ascosphaera pollenicola]
MAEDKRQSVLITGCSNGGIGHSLALEFLKNGLRVFATARDRETISDLKEKGIDTLSLLVDNEESVKACFKEVSELLGGKGLDYLVNNALVIPHLIASMNENFSDYFTVPALDIDMTEVRQTFETNVFAVMYMCQTFSSLLIKAKGTIVQLGSLAGMMPYVFGSVYNASKAALHIYSDTLRVELAPFGVKVITIVTGGVKSRIARTPRALSKDSLYYPINSEFQRRLTHSQSVGIPNEQYAKQVVTEILYGRAPWRWIWPWSKPSHYIWAGGKVTVAWICNWGWTWYGLSDYVFSWMFGLNKLKRYVK